MFVHFSNGNSRVGVIYIADEENAAYLGPLPVNQIARHISQSIGPSGTNSDYVHKLANSLRERQFHDEHVFAVENELDDLNR